MSLERAQEFLDAHLNVYWLRPESALWDAIASEAVSRFSPVVPSLDLGCGNGLFSFLTWGGGFTEQYDWFRNASPENFFHNRDIFDTFHYQLEKKHRKKAPATIDVGLDLKQNLLMQAKPLGFYKRLVQHDANTALPFETESFRAVFSNIIYWLKNPLPALREIHRILTPGGSVILCLPNSNFYSLCPSYQWQKKKSKLLQVLNCGRSDSIQTTFSLAKVKNICNKAGFVLKDHQTYLSPVVLKIWDVGLRPISPYLISMANSLDDRKRLAMKKRWMNTMKQILIPLLEMNYKFRGAGGFHICLLEKTL